MKDKKDDNYIKDYFWYSLIDLIFNTKFMLTVILAILLGYAIINSIIIDRTPVYINDFRTAIIKLPNDKVIEGEIKSYINYKKSNQIQITFDNGITYLINSDNVALIY